MMFRQAFAAAAALALAAAPAFSQGVSTPKGASFGAGVVDTATGRKQFCVSEAPGGLCLPFLALNPTNHLVSFGNASVVTVPTAENGNFASSGDAAVSFCQAEYTCVLGHSYATSLTQMTTVGDGTRQEIAHAINVTNSQGYQFNADAINNGVEGLFIGYKANAGGAKVWGQATDLVLGAGWRSDFAAISELDMTNNAYDCPPNGTGPDGLTCAIFGHWVGGQIGAYPDTAALFVSPTNTNGTVYAHHFGLAFEGPYTVKDVTYSDGTNAGIAFDVSGTHSVEVFNEHSVSPVAINLGGTYSSAAITTANATTNVGVALKQGQSLCLNTYATCMVGYPVSGSAPAGILTANLSVTGQLVAPLVAPVSATAPCSIGQIEFDGNYIYTCYAANSWHRVAAGSSW